MKKGKVPLRKATSTQEVVVLLERDIDQFKGAVKAAGKLSGRQRKIAIGKLDRRSINNINNLLMALETSILTKEEQNDHIGLQELKQEYEGFQTKFQKLRKEMQFIRNEGMKEKDIFEDRSNPQLMDKQEYAAKIEGAQKESEQAVVNMLRVLHQTKQVGNTVNAQLQRQLQALDSINQSLRDTESTMNRALRHINYFARSVYTDKLLIVLIILIVLAIVAIIVLSAMGKVGGATADVLT